MPFQALLVLVVFPVFALASVKAPTAQRLDRCGDFVAKGIVQGTASDGYSLKLWMNSQAALTLPLASGTCPKCPFLHDLPVEATLSVDALDSPARVLSIKAISFKHELAQASALKNIKPRPCRATTATPRH